MHYLNDQQRLLAEQAREKMCPYAEDITIDDYIHEPDQDQVPTYEKLLVDERETLTKAGFNVDDQERAASFLQVDHRIGHCSRKVEGVEVLSMRQALETYDGLPEYWWQAVQVDADKYTAKVALDFDDGYFIRALAGSKTRLPVQACLFMNSEKLLQNVHNIIVLEEGAELEIISGCATAHQLQQGLHLGVSELYIKKNSRLTFTMIHDWGGEVMARPRTVVQVEEGGAYVSNYISMKKVRSLQMYPTAYLRGRGAMVRFNSIVAAPSGSHLDLGSRVVLSYPECRAEVISRAVSFGGDIVARGHLVGEDPSVKAHLECHGLMLRKYGLIHAIPELEGRVSGVEMFHEAAVGKIAQEEVEYLMARGLSEEEATSTIIRGFLNVEIVGLPASLQKDLDELLAKSDEGGM